MADCGIGLRHARQAACGRGDGNRNQCGYYRCTRRRTC